MNADSLLYHKFVVTADEKRFKLRGTLIINFKSPLSRLPSDRNSMNFSWVYWSFDRFEICFTIFTRSGLDSWEISQDFVSCLHKTSNQTLVQLYFSFAAEVINYLTWKTLANTILQNHQWINKIHRAFTALIRIIIEDLKRCRAREWELNGASCCFSDSFRAIWNYILITF